MEAKKFDVFEERIKPEIIKLIDFLKTTIDDDFRIEGQEPDDMTPTMQVTISCDDDLEEWSYQTGDNSFTGGCYGHPYWGIAYITRDSNSSGVVGELIESLADVIDFD